MDGTPSCPDVGTFTLQSSPDSTVSIVAGFAQQQTLDSDDRWCSSRSRFNATPPTYSTKPRPLAKSVGKPTLLPRKDL